MQSAGKWKNLARNIGKQFSGLSDTCMDPVVFVFKFGRFGDRVAGYVDSGYARDIDKRRSSIGYILTIGGCAIS